MSPSYTISICSTVIYCSRYTRLHLPPLYDDTERGGAVSARLADGVAAAGGSSAVSPRPLYVIVRARISAYDAITLGQAPPEPIEMHCIVQISKKRVSTYKSMRVPGAIFIMTEIAPRGRGYWLESDTQAADCRSGIQAAVKT